MPILSLPARSLRRRPASLRTFPDSAWSWLSKPLIWRALLAIGRAISGAQSIFLPALREEGSGRRPLAQQELLLAGQDPLAVLVVHGHPERDDAGRALRHQCGYLQHRVERVAGIDRL